MRRSVRVFKLGSVPYGQALELQHRLQRARIRGAVGDTLLLLEHPAVITLGRGANAANVLLTKEILAQRGVERFEIGRGGDVTYHGPGQVVGYPIFDLNPDRRDVRRYVRDLEEIMVRIARDHELEAGRIEGLNGAWIEDRKIGAVGVRISRWVTMHGFALNVSTDLSHFAMIVPCGIQNKAVTSLAAELGRSPSVQSVMDRVADHVADIFDADVSGAEGDPLLGLTEADVAPDPWRSAPIKTEAG